MTTCRSCGFTHKPEDLIDGQCPRWAPPVGMIDRSEGSDYSERDPMLDYDGPLKDRFGNWAY